MLNKNISVSIHRSSTYLNIRICVDISTSMYIGVNINGAIYY